MPATDTQFDITAATEDDFGTTRGAAQFAARFGQSYRGVCAALLGTHRHAKDRRDELLAGALARLGDKTRMGVCADGAIGKGHSPSTTGETASSHAVPSMDATAPSAVVAATSATLPATITSATLPGHLTVNLELDAKAQAASAYYATAFQTAANLISDAIADPITVNLSVDVSGTGGGAAAGPSDGVYDSYSDVRSQLLSSATTPAQLAAVDSLPTGTSIQGQSQVAVWGAQEKLFGLEPATDPSVDGNASFAKDIAQNQLVGVAIHELTHAMGRVPFGDSSDPEPDIFDLFRFTSAGNRYFSDAIPAAASYFSLDGGNTDIADYGENSDPSDFLNPPASNLTPNDPFNEYYGSSTQQSFTAIDLKQLEALGFNVPGAGMPIWTGQGGTASWSNAANWSDVAVPGASDPVQITNGIGALSGAYGVTYDLASSTIASLDIDGLGTANPTLTIGAGDALTVSGAVTVTNSGAIVLGGTLTVTAGEIDGSITNGGSAGNIVKTGTGTLTLAATNTYAGGTTISGGTLVAGHGNGSDDIDALGSGTVTLDGGTLSDGAGSVILTNAVTIGTSGGMIDDGSNGFVIQGAIAGTGDLTLTGANGDVDISQDTHHGATILSGKVIVLGNAANAFSSFSGFQVDNATGLYLDANQTIASLADGPNGGGTVTSGFGSATLTLDGTATASFSGTLEDGVSPLALVEDGGGTQTLSGAGMYSGGTKIDAGTIDDAPTTAGTSSIGMGDVTFGSTGAQATLALGSNAQPASGGTFGNTLDDFDSSTDSLDLEGFTFDSLDVAYLSDGTSLTVSGGTGGTQTETFTLTNGALAYTAQADSAGTGTLITAAPVCFAAGTLIRVLRDGAAIDVAVERLAVGDLAVTASGEARPIRWLGHRTIDCRTHPRQREVMPVRIAAHAFEPNRPVRDLLVSPGHAICLDFLGELLIPAGKLVNGATISRHPVDQVTYWHVDLDSHDILIAENLPAESFLDCGNRAGLVEQEGEFDRMASPHTPADFCRPFFDKDVVVEAARERLAARAEEQGWRSTSDMDLHLVVDGARIEGDILDGVARFLFPAAAREVVLASETFVPSDLADSLDHRRLGLSVNRIEIEDGLSVQRAWATGDQCLATLFHPEEAAGEAQHGFTDGRAVLPPALWDGCRGFVILRVGFAGTRHWLPPGRTEAGNVVALRVA